MIDAALPPSPPPTLIAVYLVAGVVILFMVAWMILGVFFPLTQENERITIDGDYIKIVMEKYSKIVDGKPEYHIVTGDNQDLEVWYPYSFSYLENPQKTMWESIPTNTEILLTSNGNLVSKPALFKQITGFKRISNKYIVLEDNCKNCYSVEVTP